MIRNEDWSTMRRLLLMRGAAGGSLKEYEAEGNPAVFQTNVAKPLTGFTIPFLPIQQGSGDPSPQNQRPIIGWQGLTAWRTRENLFDEAYPGIDENMHREYVFVGNNTVYISTSCPVTGTGSALLFAQTGRATGGESTTGNGVSNNQPRQLTPVDGWVTISYRIQSGIDPRDYETMLNFGTTRLPYAPYTGQSYPVIFPVTVYGGTAYPLDGMLSVEWVSLTRTWGNFGNKTSLGDNTRGTLSISSYPSKPTGMAVDAKCNIAPRDTGWSTDSTHFYTNEGSCIVFLPNDTDASTEIQVVYPLATPIEIQIDPLSISTLIGDNTIWTDTNGENTVRYKKKG